jgi:hypothetical protein
MAHMKLAFLLAFIVPAASLKAVSRGDTQATPVEKVVQLLEKLSVQIGEEGKKEAAEYDKYACFCKEQADQKIYQIEKSEALIEALKAEIEKLDAEIADLSAAIATLGEEITALEKEIEDEEAARKEEHEKYLAKDEEMVEAIDAVTAAIAAIQASKAEMTDTKLAALPQVRAAAAKTQRALKTLSLHAGSAKTLALLQDLVEQPGEVKAYSYHSNEIIDTLKNLLIEFKQTKKELDEAEFEARSISEKKVLGLTNEKTFKEKDKAQKEAIVEEKTATLHEKTKEKDAETEAMDADIAFKEELQTQCEGAAKQFDQRSTTRASELTAISEALEILKTGVNYDANKKLVGLAAKHAVVRRQPGRAHNPVSLFQQHRQQRKGAGSAKAAVIRRVLQHLGDSADRLHSPMLLALVTKASAQEDHFAKVRALISDLIARLEQEALDEADQKSFCDEQMASAIENRDAEQLNIEGETATIAKKEAEVKKLTKEIAELSEEIAELNKALNEATELRAQEKANNEKTLEDAEAGKAAVEEAIDVLKKFYDSAFLQKKQKQPAVDREGKAVSDYAPKLSYDDDYKGNQDASKGIFGLLEVIVSDFERTITTVTDEESAAQSAFEEFETATKTSIEDKEKDKDTKEGEVADAEDAIMSAKDAKKTAEDLHSSALKELEKLKPMCVEGEMSYAERVEKREQEVAALKEALKILEEWKS